MEQMRVLKYKILQRYRWLTGNGVQSWMVPCIEWLQNIPVNGVQFDPDAFVTRLRAERGI